MQVEGSYGPPGESVLVLLTGLGQGGRDSAQEAGRRRRQRRRHAGSRQRGGSIADGGRHAARDDIA